MIKSTSLACALVASLAVVSVAQAQPAGEPEPVPSPPSGEPPAPPPVPPPAPVATPPAVVDPPAAAPGATPPAPPDANAALGVTPDRTQRPQRFVIFHDEARGMYLKPLIWIAGSVAAYFPESRGNPELANRITTLALSRFGFEGALNPYVEFALQFERNLGFSIASGGPIGTGIWEGTASLSSRESYIRLRRWGVELSAGIVADPATVDYMPSQVFDLFGMDPYVRDPLLNSGFNMAQGVLFRYHFAHLGVPGRLVPSMMFSSGNPLITSLSFGFGGVVSSGGTLFTAPLRSITAGLPGSSIEVQTYSPSLTYEYDITDKIGIDVHGGAQFYKIDIDLLSSDDIGISGYNVRAGARLRLPYVNLMGNYSRRRNDQLPIPDLTTLSPDDYKAYVYSVGAEGNFRRLGAGVDFANVKTELSPTVYNTARYVNAAVSYDLEPSFLAVSLRYASLWNKPRGTATVPIDANTLLLTLRLTI